MAKLQDRKGLAASLDQRTWYEVGLIADAELFTVTRKRGSGRTHGRWAARESNPEPTD